MNRLALIGAALAVAVSAAVAMAASPSPSPSAGATATPGASASPTASPVPSGAPTASPAPSPSASALAAQGQTWSAQVQPVTVTGTATVDQLADGRGTITLQLTGMVDEQAWTVDVDAGTIEMPRERVNIAFRSGDEVQRVAPDSIKIQLTKSEMDAFIKAQKSTGAVIFIGDGTRLSAAVVPAQ
jgi:hypothetical protein